MSDLHYLSATEAIERFRARELSPVELMEAVIARAAEVEPTVNALCHTFYDEALEQARAAEARYAPGGEAPRPLEGIPTAVKEEEAIAGQPWTQGSLIYKDLVAEHTSAFARRHHRGRRDRPRARHRAGVLVRRLHAVADLGRHAQPVEPGVRGGRLVGRLGRRARGRDDDARQRLGHRRLDPHPGVVQRRRRVQAAVRPRPRRPAVQPRHLLPLRPAGAHRRRLRALRERRSPGRTPRTSRPCARSSLLPEHFDGIEGLRIAFSPDLGDWPVDEEVRANTLALAETLRAAGADGRRRRPACAACGGRARDGDPLPPRVRRLDRRAGDGAPRPRHALRDRDGALVLESSPPAHSFLEEIELEAKLYAPVGALLERVRRADLPDLRHARAAGRRRLRRPRARGGRGGGAVLLRARC